MQEIGEIPPFILLEIKLDIYLISYYIGVFKKSRDDFKKYWTIILNEMSFKMVKALIRVWGEDWRSGENYLGKK